jgi:ribonucleoside-triphosphate reductase
MNQVFKIKKKDGRIVSFNPDKIKAAVTKSADRVLVQFTQDEYDRVIEIITEKLGNLYKQRNLQYVDVPTMHKLVEMALDEVSQSVAKSYRDYRNYKQEFVDMFDRVHRSIDAVAYRGDKSNSNTDSKLVTTQRSIGYNKFNDERYKKFFLNPEERQAAKDGYIYIHDRSARLDTMNCFRRDTRFITKDGVKSFYDFQEGDETIVLSHTGKWRKAVVHKYGWQSIQKVVLSKKTPTSKPVNIYCTKNHRWILKDGSYTTNLQIGDDLFELQDRTRFDWNTLSVENKKLWCRGFAKGDGAAIGKQGIGRQYSYVIVRLCDGKIKYADRFKDAGYSVKPIPNSEDLIVHMLDTQDKNIPFYTLNYNNILYYINGLMCADGNRNKENGRTEFKGIQITGDLNDYIYDMLNMAGYYVSSYQDLTGEETNYGIRKKQTIRYYVSYLHHKTSSWRVIDIQEEKLNPKSEVWCLDVEEDHSFILEGGIPTGNCALLDVKAVFDGGFEMGNIFYTDPHTVDVACDVLGDVIMAAASSQYGGLSVRIDDFLAPYCQKSFDKYYTKYFNMIKEATGQEPLNNDIAKYARKDTIRELEQGLQGLEIKLNSVASSRGDYPFVSFAFGIDTSEWGRVISETALRVRMGGQGKEGFKRPVLFPKLIFLYDENLHGTGGELEELFNVAIQCSSKCMYPDFLSLTGEGYVPSMYKKYGKVVYPMGCRAFLSPWYERGGMNPADENDIPVFTGRFNVGAITLNLIMILAKAREEGKDFYEVLDYYLEMIRGLHLRTYEFLGNKRASISPLTYCEGGFYGGHLQPNDKIAPVLKTATASFGITGLNELNVLYNGKTITEDGQFPLEVMEYINKKVDKFKKEDKRLYAIYGTPAESLCGLQIEQFRAKYGIIEGVSSRAYTTNSFHCWVGEDIDPIQKQDIEYKFWNLFNGGKIQYVRYPIDYNIEAIKTLVRRAMKMGYYEGINMALSYCNDCGHQELNMDTCPICGSSNLTKIDRMNGYLSYSRVKGDTMLNAAKMEEIKDRKSM